MRMVRYMCRVSLRERKTNAELRKSLGIKDIDEVMRWSKAEIDESCAEER